MHFMYYHDDWDANHWRLSYKADVVWVLYYYAVERVN
jgi:hypothetical protein